MCGFDSETKILNICYQTNPHLHSISKIDLNIQSKIVIIKSILIQQANPLSEKKKKDTKVSIWKIFKANFVGITF